MYAFCFTCLFVFISFALYVDVTSWLYTFTLTRVALVNWKWFNWKRGTFKGIVFDLNDNTRDERLLWLLKEWEGDFHLIDVLGGCRCTCLTDWQVLSGSNYCCIIFGEMRQFGKNKGTNHFKLSSSSVNIWEGIAGNDPKHTNVSLFCCTPQSPLGRITLVFLSVISFCWNKILTSF